MRKEQGIMVLKKHLKEMELVLHCYKLMSEKQTSEKLQRQMNEKIAVANSEIKLLKTVIREMEGEQ